MRTRRTLLSSRAAALLAGIAGAKGRPVVVELFASQGCSSCPPAEAVLLDLARRPDVLALAFHLDCWDRLAWSGPYASPGVTARRRAYAALLGEAQAYTPQVVIDGRREMVGSRHAQIGAGPGSPAVDLGWLTREGRLRRRSQPTSSTWPR